MRFLPRSERHCQERYRLCELRIRVRALNLLLHEREHFKQAKARFRLFHGHERTGDCSATDSKSCVSATDSKSCVVIGMAAGFAWAMI